MGVLDKFLNVMRLNPEDDDDFYNEDYDYDDDYTEDEPKQTFRREKKRETVEKDYDSDRPKETPVKSSSKVTPIRPSKKQTGPGGMQVCVIKPTSVEDAREITETLLENRTVVLNVEGLDVEIAQRIIDFTSRFMLCNSVVICRRFQITSSFITPASVDISGDFLSLMDSFETRGIQTDF